MTRRRRRDDFLDARVTQHAVDLFCLAKEMLRRGFTFSHATPPIKFKRVSSNVPDGEDLTREYKTLIQVSRELDRELGIKPWQPGVLDFEVYAMEASRFPPHAEFHVIADLHRRLTAATAE